VYRDLMDSPNAGGFVYLFSQTPTDTTCEEERKEENIEEIKNVILTDIFTKLEY
jgi:hypothetical protein